MPAVMTRKERQELTREQVTEAAAKIADAKLQEAGLEILTETTRYVGLDRKQTIKRTKGARNCLRSPDRAPRF